MKPVVAIVGRPNVGKSTLFNKLIGHRKAIATDEPGVTRDLNFGEMREGSHLFTLVDTGGFEPDVSELIPAQIREQALLAIEEADAIVFLMDARTGPTHEDGEIVSLLRRSGKPVFFAANKVDGKVHEHLTSEFYSLGIDNIFGISAEHGGGVYELIEALVAVLPEPEPEPEPEDGAEYDDADDEQESKERSRRNRVRVALVGRPNAGKSSLLNRIAGKRRAIVTDIAGTTRDSVDMDFETGDPVRKYTFIDTAGIRKKARISRRVETYCVMEAVRSIERCDVACLVIDGTEGVQGQDERVAGLIDRRGRGCVIVVNKWDIVEKDTMATKRFEESIRFKVPFLAFAPIVFVSALTGKRVDNVLSAVDQVNAQLDERVTTGKLNDVFASIKVRKRPPVYRGKTVKLYYVTQAGTRPPTFIVFTSHSEAITHSYKRYLINSLREALGLDIVPIRVRIKQRK